ncbi:MAG TPA: hypothetical protein VFU90_12520, partial [Candidatus Tumulicola sp.]|nr:hypothetical protein [Candidatus Tumulicola sp.]
MIGGVVDQECGLQSATRFLRTYQRRRTVPHRQDEGRDRFRQRIADFERPERPGRGVLDFARDEIDLDHAIAIFRAHAATPHLGDAAGFEMRGGAVRERERGRNFVRQESVLRLSVRTD